jgi:hypothetical protein
MQPGTKSNIRHLLEGRVVSCCLFVFTLWTIRTLLLLFFSFEILLQSVRARRYDRFERHAESHDRHGTFVPRAKFSIAEIIHHPFNRRLVWLVILRKHTHTQIIGTVRDIDLRQRTNDASSTTSTSTASTTTLTTIANSAVALLQFVDKHQVIVQKMDNIFKDCTREFIYIYFSFFRSAIEMR